MSKEKNKNQNTVKHVESVEVENGEEISINLQPYIVPISIILGSIIISLSIIFSIKGQLFTQTNTGATITPTPTTTVDANPAATTTINGAPYIGDKSKAKVAIVEFSDFECPYCQRHHEQVYPSIVKNYVDTGKVVYAYRTYIAVSGHNPAATLEANAAYCLNEQLGGTGSKFFEYSVAIYKNTTTNGGGLTGTKLWDLAKDLGANSATVKSCAESNKFAEYLANDQKLAEAAGIQGTPGFVVGKLAADGTVTGKIIAGAYPITEFDSMIAEMLK